MSMDVSPGFSVAQNFGKHPQPEKLYKNDVISLTLLFPLYPKIISYPAPRSNFSGIIPIIAGYG